MELRSTLRRWLNVVFTTCLKSRSSHREQVFHAIPCLEQYAQYTVGLAARPGGNAFRHLFLYHARTARDKVFVIEHLEEYLAGNVIRVVARKYERLSAERPFQMHFQEIVFYDVFFQLGIVGAQRPPPQSSRD